METEREFTTADLANAGSEPSVREDGTDAVATDERTSSRSGDEQAHGESAQQTSQSQPNMNDAVDEATAPLFPSQEATRFREQWVQVQGGFVDQPREAVEQADRLVADLMQRLASQFSDTRAELERRWDGQEDVSTEDLRVAMTQYRSFFERLLQA